MMFPTTSVPKFAVALVIVVEPLVTPSVTLYCGESCCDQSVPEAPATKPPPLVSFPVVRTSHTVFAASAMLFRPPIRHLSRPRRNHGLIRRVRVIPHHRSHRRVDVLEDRLPFVHPVLVDNLGLDG